MSASLFFIPTQLIILHGLFLSINAERFFFEYSETLFRILVISPRSCDAEQPSSSMSSPMGVPGHLSLSSSIPSGVTSPVELLTKSKMRYGFPISF